MTQAPETTCEELFFQRIAQVDASAEDYRSFFECLWRAHSGTVFRLAYSLVKNREDARDLCQDTFLRAMQYIQEHPGQIPLRVNFRAWLCTIARRLVIDRFRKVMVGPSRAPGESVGELPVEQPPEARTSTSEDLAILRNCLQQLTERARQMILLREMEGLSQKRIADKVNSNPNAVCVALHRARKALRDCVAMGHGQVGANG